ncbi:histidinol-phosphatase [Actinorhabdospora filicis]|uniref:Histidinol-phosphatase n=1 Tax=Actinorhabdospora filicis TaxID=1785913 RepID=A0A9W6SIA8_9ACTN|nr:inositol monophosphatase family protein [Actinorhabdospora filicis]GLZ76485.1 histidinol-phosphatase [Actinorhabdospora filicis]
MTDDLALARRLADLADPISMRYFRSDALGAETKADGSIVTAADKEIERVLRAELASAAPADRVIGEEYGSDADDTGAIGSRYWIIDPIDGTAHFASGKSAWSTLIGLRVGETVTVGLASAPALDKRWWASEEGAWVAPNGGSAVRLGVTDVDGLAEVRMGMWPVGKRLNESQRRVWEALSERVATVRPTADEGGSLREATGNVHGGLMVAEGLLDAYVLLGGGPWDHAAIVPIVTGAGGRFSDLEGGTRVDTGAGVYTNGKVHDEVLRVIAAAL